MKNEPMLMTRWHRLAVRVHRWAKLDAAGKKAAADAARMHKTKALACYLAIARSLR
jgi:hypothetical protein